MKFSDIPRNPDCRTLRQFAALWILFFGILGGWQIYRSNDWGWLLIGLSLIAGIPGLFWPKLLKPIFVTWMILAFPIGWMISHVILASVFYGLFVPLGLALRATGHDPLKCKKSQLDTYWEPKTQQDDVSRYLKQF
jgi:hypothetical protein